MRRRGERGGGTVLGLMLVMVLLGALLALSVLGRAVHARGVARAAADLAALSAATALHHPTALHDPSAVQDPCTRAAQVAAGNDAVVRECRVEGRTVVVSATVGVDLGVFGRREAHATARAGPAEN